MQISARKVVDLRRLTALCSFNLGGRAQTRRKVDVIRAAVSARTNPRRRRVRRHVFDNYARGGLGDAAATKDARRTRRLLPRARGAKSI